MYHSNNCLPVKTKSPDTLHWDNIRKRWLGFYRGVCLSISATKLGGTNTADTETQAKRWFEQKKTEINAKLDSV
jgi:hypothetical protein